MIHKPWVWCLRICKLCSIFSLKRRRIKIILPRVYEYLQESKRELLQLILTPDSRPSGSFFKVWVVSATMYVPIQNVQKGPQSYLKVNLCSQSAILHFDAISLQSQKVPSAVSPRQCTSMPYFYSAFISLAVVCDGI